MCVHLAHHLLLGTQATAGSWRIGHASTVPGHRICPGRTTLRPSRCCFDPHGGGSKQHIGGRSGLPARRVLTPSTEPVRRGIVHRASTRSWRGPRGPSALAPCPVWSRIANSAPKASTPMRSPERCPPGPSTGSAAASTSTVSPRTTVWGAIWWSAVPFWPGADRRRCSAMPRRRPHGACPCPGRLWAPCTSSSLDARAAEAVRGCACTRRNSATTPVCASATE
ncbi:hypothetical protein FM114_06630 [Luteococcus japonicus LSP_Lj1]|uniref:Uncharacterized protein n=1 Tax=Luteococcus japonicus LSP_Lj1 TaxID=1255658 RepID=A0A1R4JBM1_9ACTN|nr:hypothetical protein FM114_06630 [Luteococcus japonicus LSP_Lj1]